MPQQRFPIEHYDGDTSHGPVTLFIADDGQMVLVCEKDDQGWLLPQTAEPVERRGRGARDSAEAEGRPDDRALRAEVDDLTLDIARGAFRGD